MNIVDLANTTGIDVEILMFAYHVTVNEKDGSTYSNISVPTSTIVDKSAWGKVRQWLGDNCKDAYRVPETLPKKKENVASKAEIKKLDTGQIGGEINKTRGLTAELANDIERQKTLAKNKVGRATKNCGGSAALVIDGLRRKVPHCRRMPDCNQTAAFELLCGPAQEHVLWDITFQHHTFIVEQVPGGENLPRARLSECSWQGL